MKIAYINKKFRGNSLELIKLVNHVVSEYQAQGYSLTLRQVYYQMVARDIIPNNIRSYKNLGNLINDGRLAGYIDWFAIEDRTRNLRTLSHWNTPESIIESAASSYQRNWWEGQEYYVEVWVEKDALIGIVGEICNKLDVAYFSCRGYVSQSELWSAARRLKQKQDYGQKPVILHLGDHDPSGKDMSRDIIDRLDLFGVPSVKFYRIALNMDQIEEYNPPPNPTKITDSRASGYIAEFGHECWELDALEPKTISDLIRKHVKKYRNEEIYERIRDIESDEIAQLERLYKSYKILQMNWTDIADTWGIDY
jgi:hypothetical protein